MEKVQNATELRRALLELWDMVIDIQDQVSTALTLLTEQMPRPDDDPAWIFRPGQPPERVNLAEYAKEVLGNGK